MNQLNVFVGTNRMTCTHCLSQSPRWHMKNICCLARHVLYRFYGEAESAKQYAIELAKKYGVDANELKQEVVNQMKGVK